MAVKVESGQNARGWRALTAAVIAVLLAASWMVLSIVAGKAGLGKALTAESNSRASMAQALTRNGVTKFGSKIQAFYAIPEYYERTGQTAGAAEVRPDKYLAFIVSENDHVPLTPAVPSLLVDGKPLQVPVKELLLSASDHHRTRLIRFPRADASGNPYIPASAQRLELAWPDVNQVHAPDHALRQPLGWDLPLRMPADVAAEISPFAFLLLTAGLFAALSPCLVQLTLYYLSALAGAAGPAGATAGAGGAGGVSAPATAATRRRIIMTAVYFVVGISAAYVLGGLLAGYMGRTLQVSNVLGEYGRYMAVGAGGVIVWMGFRTVLTANQQLVCRMPFPFMAKLAQWKSGPLSPFLMGFLMSLGCLQCFGGAIFASLLLYVGSLGSPGLGALMLFLFSLGIAIPFLGAAFAWERVARWLEDLSGVVRAIAFGSGVAMMAFGVLMITDRFHWVSAVVLEYLPFLSF